MNNFCKDKLIVVKYKDNRISKYLIKYDVRSNKQNRN